MNVNYDNLARAQSGYKSLGYKYIEVPWLVSEAVNDITRPSWVAQYFVTKNGKKKTFIGSGEQGFLYLICKGYLAPGFYQTITPCIRNDDFDAWHTKYFMKNELIIFGHSEVTEEYILEGMIAAAKKIFTDLGMNRVLIDKTDEGYDITADGIELGSYGVRECEFVRWIYGTGLAEPRFSTLLKTQEKVNELE